MFVNPEIDEAELIESYRKNGYVFIKEFLRDDVANTLAAALSAIEEWSVHVIGSSSDYSNAEIKKMSSAERCSVVPDPPANYMQPRGALGVYERYLILEKIRSGDCPDELITYFEGINSSEYVGLMQRITGIDTDVWISADASRYRAGHFLAAHTDTAVGDGSPKLVAHVLGLTRHWSSASGGELVFCDNWGRDIRRGEPNFNCLALFRVPRRHYVRAVSPQAEASRFSLYGWLMRRPAAANAETGLLHAKAED